MKVYYYYHIPKTGGTSVYDLFEVVAKEKTNSVIYNFNSSDDITSEPKSIDFDRILSAENVKKYDYIFIHHHHGYHGIMHYKDILIKRKQELESIGSTMTIFTTVREIMSFNNSRFNYLIDECNWEGDKQDFLTDEMHFNVQSKYFFFSHHGEWPQGDVTIEDVNDKLTEENILSLKSVIDIFVETKDLSRFMKDMCETLNIHYNVEERKNINKHSITFNDVYEQLRDVNSYDYFLLKSCVNYPHISM